MECAPHRIWKKLMALVLSLVLMAVMLPGALAVDLNVDVVYVIAGNRKHIDMKKLAEYGTIIKVKKKDIYK